MILGILLAVLIILIFLVCGDQGTRSIVSTVMNAAVLLIALFLMTRGAQPILTTLACSVVITAVTLFYQNGVNIKSLAAFISVVAVILVLLPVVWYFADGANAAGFPPENYEITDSEGYTRNIDISMLQLQISIMIIALIGTVIDTAVAIISSIYEIRENNREMPLEELIRSSFRVSRAVLNTSIHTIFYIYIAEYMTLFIQYVSDYSFAAVLNSKSLAHELISIAVSGMGCCLVVPAATVIGALMIRGRESSEGSPSHLLQGHVKK